MASKIELYTGEKFHEKRSACPGSKTYYLNNTLEKKKFSPTSYTDEELIELQKYLPRCFPSKVFLGKNPNEIVEDDGWIFDEKKNLFQHPSFTQSDKKTPIYFEGVLKEWDNKRYLVPLSKDEIVDKDGLCWSYSSVSTCMSLDKNKAIDYWGSRRGKRMAKYIEYRKRRTKRNEMLSHK